MFSTLIFVVSVIGFIQAAKLPDGIVTCKIEDLECLAKSVTVAIHKLSPGLPSLGIPKLEPLDVPQIHIKGNGGSIDLEQSYEDLKLYGLSDITFSKIIPNFQGSNCGLIMEGLMPRVEMIAKYKFTGKLLLFVINGFGKSNITLINTAVKNTFECEKVTKNGKEYAHITSGKLDLQPEKLHFSLPNLVDGNEQLSTEVEKVMNENDQDIYREIKKDYEATFLSILQQITTSVYDRVALKDMYVQ